jgi:hypothetical protein
MVKFASIGGYAVRRACDFVESLIEPKRSTLSLFLYGAAKGIRPIGPATAAAAHAAERHHRQLKDVVPGQREPGAGCVARGRRYLSSPCSAQVSERRSRRSQQSRETSSIQPRAWFRRGCTLAKMAEARIDFTRSACDRRSRTARIIRQQRKLNRLWAVESQLCLAPIARRMLASPTQ